MKKNIEITGEIADVTGSYVGIRLHICSFDGITDFFAVDTEEKEILTRLNATTKILLKMEHTFEDYMQLIKDLGLEIPSKWKKHWAPKTGERYFYIDSQGEVYPNYIAKFGYNEVDQKRYENYNAFPTMELAEKAVNLSKLGRLILLWQYANDCLFEPVWNNKRSRKHYFYYSHNLERILVGDYFDFQDDILYFETEEQTKAFVDMYSEEIKKSMRVI